MDEFPAGPASPSPRGPALAVVIPVHDGGADFERCLRGLRDSTRQDFELIVVDDASRDESPRIAEDHGARVIRQASRSGPAAARNAGALAATARWVFFLDADVAVHPDAVARAMARIEADPTLDGLFGSYDDRPAAPGLVSRFRNLLHHHVHQSGTFVDDARPARTFWTGCGLIRREVFLAAGGFDPLLYRRPAIEDIELGYRVTRAGHRIVLARDVRATHLKRWSLVEMVRTDVFRRGVPWMLLMKRSRIVETDLNVSAGQRACVALTGLGLLGLLLAPVLPALGLALPIALGGIVGLNRGFYRFLVRTRGPAFAAAATGLHLVYYCCCGASVAIALGYWHLARGRVDRAGPSFANRRLDPPEVPEPALIAAPTKAPRRRRSPTR